jgi:hypothetical protein
VKPSRQGRIISPGLTFYPSFAVSHVVWRLASGVVRLRGTLLSLLRHAL